MEILHPRCAGLDLSKRDAKVCLRVVPAGKVRAVQEITTWFSMTGDILALREYLIESSVTCVAMEATGDYWKPFYYVLEDGPFEVMLVNARDAKKPAGPQDRCLGRSLAGPLAAHGLVRASFVPPEPIRRLRDLTRTRTAITRERTREAQRLEKVLEDAGIKLSVVAADITGKSGRAILGALVAGERDPDVLADLSVRQLRAKIPALTQALRGRFNDHHTFLVDLHLQLIDQHTAAIAALTARIEEVISPFSGRPRTDHHDPRHRHPDRRRDHRRDRRRHDPVRRPRQPRILGRRLPRAPRIRRPVQVQQDPPG